MPKPLIALDADGVLLDYHLAIADAWERAFGSRPRERDPQAYWPRDRWEVDLPDATDRARMRAHLDDTFWSTMHALPGAIDACNRLHDAGFQLVCVSALEVEFESARLRNLRARGFPIERVIATGNAAEDRSPKAGAIEALRPLAFVDDFLPYLRGVPAEVHTALVLRAPNGSPNTGDELTLASSIHQDLAGFADHWLDGEGHTQPSPGENR